MWRQVGIRPFRRVGVDFSNFIYFGVICKFSIYMSFLTRSCGVFFACLNKSSLCIRCIMDRLPSCKSPSTADSASLRNVRGASVTSSILYPTRTSIRSILRSRFHLLILGFDQKVVGADECKTILLSEFNSVPLSTLFKLCTVFYSTFRDGQTPSGLLKEYECCELAQKLESQNCGAFSL